MCRVTAVILDLALVSYVGSHGTHFTSYVESASEEIRLVSKHADLNVHFKCTFQTLACLNGFLDNTRVWVFQTYQADQGSFGDFKKSTALSVLARMKDFADIWGPVWPVPVGAESPSRLRQYNLSRGFIRPIAETNTSRGLNAVMCHWYSTTLTSDTPTSTPAATAKTLSHEDLLLIGASLVENQIFYTSSIIMRVIMDNRWAFWGPCLRLGRLMPGALDFP